MQCNDVASTSFWRHVPTRFLINQCQIIIFLILKSDDIENSRIELKGIVLQVRSNQIKVTFIIILPFNLLHLWFFPVSHRNWRKIWVNYWGGGGGAKGYVGSPSQIMGRGGGGGVGGGAGPPLPMPMNGSSVMHDQTEETQIRQLSEEHSSQGLCVWLWSTAFLNNNWKFLY